MNKEERVKLVFETISKIAGFEIKPNKEFYINIDGKRKVYKISENLQLLYEYSGGYYETSLLVFFNILSGCYSLEEIEEPLLTEEERGFLRHFKFKALEVDLHCLYFGESFARRAMCRDFINLKFNGLELDKEYAREELGL